MIDEFDYINSLLRSPCIYCSNQGSGGGIDRLDLDKGFTNENSRPICRICLNMKGRLTHTEFIDHIKNILKTVAPE